MKIVSIDITIAITEKNNVIVLDPSVFAAEHLGKQRRDQTRPHRAGKPQKKRDHPAAGVSPAVGFTHCSAADLLLFD